jgi:hypothetical protein
LVLQLRAAGVSEIQVAGPAEGDRGLSAALRQALLEAWQPLAPNGA